MNSVTWRQIEKIVEPAVELQGIARQRFLDRQCGSDQAMHRLASSLLAAIDSGGSFLDNASWAPSSQLAHGDPLPTGERVGAYRIDSVLGRGGMGTVYLARRADDAFTRPVALKVASTRLGDPAAVRRFHRETYILARLEHPNIARLYDAGRLRSGLAYLVMEFVDGRPIHRHCHQLGLGLRARLRLFVKVCRAVQFAHQSLVLHRDLKPENILVDTNGEPKLLDFGIATVLDSSDLPAELLTTDGRNRPLTPLYASPEQIRGTALTTASDVYALGLLLFELLSGRPAFVEQADNPAQLVRAIAESEPPPPSRTAELTIPRDLDAITQMALRKEPHQRYVSAAQLAWDVERFLDGLPVVARRGSWAYQAGKLVRKYWQASAGLAAVLLLTLSFAVAMKLEASATARQRERAQRVTDFMVEIFGGAHPAVALGEELTVRQAIDRAVLDLPTRLAEEPEIQGELELALGTIYRELGSLTEALPLLDQAVLKKRQVFGQGSPELAQALVERGTLHTTSGRYPEALADLGQALEIQRRELGSKALQTTTTLARLGSLHGNLANWQLAEEMLSEALDNHQNTEPHHPRTATAARELGIVLAKQGRIREAKTLFTEALDTHRTRLPPSHPETLKTLECLAISTGMLGDYEQAGHYFESLLVAKERLLPANHPGVLTARHNMAVLHQKLGQVEQAEALYRQTLRMREEQLPAGSLRRFESYFSLAHLLRETGRLDEAESLARMALEHTNPVAGDAGAEEAIRRHILTLNLLAEVHQQAERPERAAATRRQLLAAVSEQDSATLTIHLQALAALAHLHLGQLEEARPLLERVVRSGIEHQTLFAVARQKGLLETEPAEDRALGR